jgi:type II secretory pathway pseudopilin PulG
MSIKKRQFRGALTLVEVVVVLMLAGVIILAVLGIYNRVRASAVVILDRLEQNRLQTEVLQKIAEDIDRLAAPGFDAIINFQNKVDNGFRSAQLILESSYYNNRDQKTTYERIIWQTSFDPLIESMILYRMHEGLNVEDKVLEKNPEMSPGSGLYIPVADGVTYFELKAQQGEQVLGAWNSETLPKGVRVGLSFEPLRELYDGSIGVPEEDVTFRTIAVDRTRLIPYQFIKKDFDLPEEDPNDISEDPNDILDLTDDAGMDEPADDALMDDEPIKENDES